MNRSQAASPVSSWGRWQPLIGDSYAMPLGGWACAIRTVKSHRRSWVPLNVLRIENWHVFKFICLFIRVSYTYTMHFDYIYPLTYYIFQILPTSHSQLHILFFVFYITHWVQLELPIHAWGGGPSTGAWVTYQRPYPWRKWTPFPFSQQLPIGE